MEKTYFFYNKKEFTQKPNMLILGDDTVNKLRTKSLKKGEVIPLNMDFMFTSIFNKEENIDILENFLSCYLEIPLEK